jgi:hypothetical protein
VFDKRIYLSFFSNVNLTRGVDRFLNFTAIVGHMAREIAFDEAFDEIKFSLSDIVPLTKDQSLKR